MQLLHQGLHLPLELRRPELDDLSALGEVDLAHILAQLEPRTGEGVRELVRVLHEAPRDLLVGGIEAQGEVRGQHRRRHALRLVVRVRHGAGTRATLRCPLLRAGRALRQLPFVAEQVPEEAA